MLSTRRSLAWSFSQEFWQKGTTFVGSICIARLLTPDEVGVFSIAMALNYLLGTFRDFGIGTYLVREPNVTNEKIRTAFGMSIVIQWALGTIIFVVSPFLASFYNEPGISDVLFLVSLTFFIAPIGQPATALLTREMRFNVLHHLTVSASIVGTISTITLAALGWSFMALAWGMVIGQFLRSFLVLFVRPDHLRLRPGFSHVRDVLNFGSWLTASGIAMTIATEGTKFVLGSFLTPGSVALFERAQQLPRHARQAIFKPVGRVVVPSFSKDIRDGRSIGPAVRTYIASLTGLLWPMCLVLGFLSTPIVLLLFGANWRIAGMLLPYLLVSMAIRACLPTPNEILVPHGLVRRLTFLRVTQAVVTLSLAAYGASHSLELFAQLLILNSLVFIALNGFAIFSLIETSASALMQQYAKSSAVALLTSLPACATYIIYGTAAPLQWVFVSLALAPPLWFLGLHLTSHPLQDEIMHVSKWIARKAKRA